MTHDKDILYESDVAELCTVPKTGLERARSRWITVEPVIVLGMMGYACVSLVRPLYVKDVIQDRYNVSDISTGNKCMAANGTGDNAVASEIQSEASMWLLYLGMASGVPAMLANIIFGTTSDKFGRKMAIALPIVGFGIQAAVYLLVVQFRLPLSVLFVGEALQGLTGGFALLFAGCVSYITDVTSAGQRTIRIIVAETLTFLIGGSIEVGAGYLIRVSFVYPLALALGCIGLALLYVAIPSVLLETVERGGSSDQKGFREMWRSMKSLLGFNENGRRWQMLLLDFFIFFSMIQALGLSAIFVLYGTAQPFCWTSSTAGIASAVMFVSASAGMVLGYKLFSMCLEDYWLIQISCISIGVSYLVLGLAQSTLVIFVGVALGCLRGIATPVARSALSKIARPGETGALFAVVGCLESLSSFISSVMTTSLYAATVSFLPPLTYYVYSAVTVIPSGIVLVLQVFWPRKKEYVPLTTMINPE